jgi:hypothetical protein
VSPVTSTESRTHMTEARNISTLPTNTKKAETLSPFVRFEVFTAVTMKNAVFLCLHLFPDLVRTYVPKISLENQLKLSASTCARLQTKFCAYVYVSFHISINDKYFSLISNAGLRRMVA